MMRNTKGHEEVQEPFLVIHESGREYLAPSVGRIGYITGGRPTGGPCMMTLLQ